MRECTSIFDVGEWLPETIMEAILRSRSPFNLRRGKGTLAVANRARNRRGARSYVRTRRFRTEQSLTKRKTMRGVPALEAARYARNWLQESLRLPDSIGGDDDRLTDLCPRSRRCEGFCRPEDDQQRVWIEVMASCT